MTDEPEQEEAVEPETEVAPEVASAPEPEEGLAA